MSKRVVVQEHHISYNPEITVKVFKGEHWIITQLMRRRNISKGFIRAVKVFLALHEDKAKEL